MGSESIAHEAAIVWFQKISRPPPRRELEIPGEWGGFRGPGNSRRDGGWTIKSLSRGSISFCFRPHRVRTLLLTDLVVHF